MRHSTLFAALSALAVAAAQNFTIDPNTVEPVLKSQWCGAEYNSCKELCGGNPTKNECDVNTLSYNCTCSNGTAPGLQYYIQTIPTFICEKAYTDCIAANINSAKAQDDCKTNIKNKCGTLDPAKAEVNTGSSSSSSSAAPSSTSAPSQTSAGGQSAAPSSSSSRAAAAATNIAYIGNGVAAVAAGVFAALL
ncbi:hypothetical protein N657DRAFT_608662 [Parathielavia appendiculata]|uniref:DUF7707 domain-containing protein n=1 Tax=Parathielavia appendiculata TaxID=2587402 RepID=A0AAN6Z948_9PEZI|nr:hypothetical protein N657DRAFT_608662 [Parathielavia appendiculata]